MFVRFFINLDYVCEDSQNCSIAGKSYIKTKGHLDLIFAKDFSPLVQEADFKRDHLGM